MSPTARFKTAGEVICFIMEQAKGAGTEWAMQPVLDSYCWMCKGAQDARKAPDGQILRIECWPTPEEEVWLVRPPDSGPQLRAAFQIAFHAGELFGQGVRWGDRG